jgi:hypothetical protein
MKVVYTEDALNDLDAFAASETSGSRSPMP